MDYSTLMQPPVSKEMAETTRNSLYEALQEIPDPRRRAGQRYPLPVLLCLLCLAKMAGQSTLKGATEWVRLRAKSLAASFGLKRTTMPCQMTYKRILEVIDVQALNGLLSLPVGRHNNAVGRSQAARPPEAGYLEHAQVAIDGKRCGRPAKKLNLSTN